MAKLYKVDGSVEDLVPENGKFFSLKEMQAAVGGLIEVVQLDEGRTLVVNEEGKMLGLPPNEKATGMALRHLFDGDWIAGNAVLCEKGEIR